VGEILRVEKINKTYGKNNVLNNIDFSINEGEVHCVVGENGAGKSTLIKILSGAVSPSSGKIVTKQKRYTSLDPSLGIKLGIAAIYQDIELIDVLTVADNIFLGSEKSKSLSIVDEASQEIASKKLLDKLKIDIDPSVLVQDLSVAQKQTLQIVKALHSECKVLIMDEPTSSLGIDETKALMSMIRELKSQGIGIIYISHYLDEIFEIGDRITVLKDGDYVGTYEASEVTVEQIVRKMVGRDAALFYQREAIQKQKGELQVKNFSWGKTVKDVSFSVSEGEIFGIGGMVGAGRTELAHLIYGIEKKDKGSLILNGEKISIKSPKQAIMNGVCLITEDRKTEALFMDRSAIENIAIVSNQMNGGFLIDSKNERTLFDDMVDKLNIILTGPEQVVGNLSGGNQQKTVIARWLLSDCKVLIFDEPTKGVDVGAREEIYKLIVDLAKQGKIIIMISSDMPELMSMSDRIGIMREGKMTHIVKDKKEEELLEYFLGVV